jgi:hypothetical protein
LGVATMGSSLSASIAPFYLGALLAGRPKALRWSKDVDDGSDCGSISPPPLLSCALAATSRGIPFASVPMADGPSIGVLGHRRSRRG